MFNHIHIGRRAFLQTSIFAAAGVQFANAEEKDYESIEAKAKSTIFIYLPGGISAQESFDPKTVAPLEYRGSMKAINTNVEGIQINERLPKVAQVMDKLTIIRSMTHGEAAHERGTNSIFTGYKPSPSLQYPSMGSVVSHELGSRNSVPGYICLPEKPNAFAGTGYLSNAYAPFSLGSDPASDSFKVRDLSINVTEDHFTRRKNLLSIVNKDFRGKISSDNVKAMDKFYEKAYDLVGNQTAQDAFDIEKEKPEVRDRYGRNQAGARMLMSRRLVEGGARFVTMTYGGWDMHQNIFTGIDTQIPPFDQAFAALIQDLSERGLLDSTLVCVISEFGRTPKVNKDAGRDHYPKVFSSILAGGGIKGGMTYGTTDATGTEPEDNPVSIPHWATTIYHQMGINANKKLMAPGDRPIGIIDDSEIIKDIIA
jgi:hypothetical protein